LILRWNIRIAQKKQNNVRSEAVYYLCGSSLLLFYFAIDLLNGSDGNFNNGALEEYSACATRESLSSLI